MKICATFISKTTFIVLFIFTCSLHAQKNDLAKLQNLIDQKGANVNLGKEIYNIYGTVNLRSNQNITGNGTKIIQKKASAPIFNTKDKTNIEISNIEFVGYKFDYQPSSSSLAVGIYCWGTKSLKIHHNKFKDFSYSAISGLRNMENAEVYNNEFVGPGLFDDRYYQKDNTGITLGGKFLNVYENDFSNSSQGIIIAEGSQNIKILRNYIHDLPLEHGIYVDYGCSDLEIRKNKIENVVGSGIKVQNRNFAEATSKNIVIAENNIDNTKIGDGILVTNTEGNALFAENVLIEKNNLNNIGQHGINIRITKNALVQNNKITNIKRSGIYLRENFNLSISRNDIQNTMESGIFDEGTGAYISILNNTIDRAGVSGIDNNGLNSGIFIEKGTDRKISGNTIVGYDDKMRYALYIANGDQKSIEIENNIFSGARDYAIRLNDSKQKLKNFKNNTLNATVGKKEVMNQPAK